MSTGCGGSYGGGNGKRKFQARAVAIDSASPQCFPEVLLLCEVAGPPSWQPSSLPCKLHFSRGALMWGLHDLQY